MLFVYGLLRPQMTDALLLWIGVPRLIDAICLWIAASPNDWRSFVMDLHPEILGALCIFIPA